MNWCGKVETENKEVLYTKYCMSGASADVRHHYQTSARVEDSGHLPKWDDAKVLESGPRKKERKVKEALYKSQTLNNKRTADNMYHAATKECAARKESKCNTLLSAAGIWTKEYSLTPEQQMGCLVKVQLFTLIQRFLPPILLRIVTSSQAILWNTNHYFVNLLL